MIEQLKQGKLITFEGIEGSGKTTQLKRLMRYCWFDETQPQIEVRKRISERFCGITQTKEPGDLSGEPDSIRNQIRNLLLNTSEPLHNQAELLLYAADRAQHYESFLKPKLDLNYLILCDRFIDSTRAYQHSARGLSAYRVSMSIQLALGSEAGALPHKTFLFDVDPEIALERAKNRGSLDRFERLGLDFHKRVREGYLKLASVQPYRITIIDASQPPDQVFEQVKEAFLKTLKGWE